MKTLAKTQMIRTRDDVLDYLRECDSHLSGREEMSQVARTVLAIEKRVAIEQNDEERAKAIWCCESLLRLQDAYLEAFALMRDGRFYDAWMKLDRAEVEEVFLSRHFVAEGDTYRVRTMRMQIPRFQALFPYKIFSSPAFIVHETRCTICGARVLPRSDCGHRKGEIYLGEMCSHEIMQADLIEISMTPDPDWKAYVVFPVDSNNERGSDPYDYSRARYVVKGLRSPFDHWYSEIHPITLPHSQFRRVGRNAPCPCGSGRKYKQCCLQFDGVVLKNHMDVYFEFPPPEDLPPLLLPGHQGLIGYQERATGTETGTEQWARYLGEQCSARSPRMDNH